MSVKMNLKILGTFDSSVILLSIIIISSLILRFYFFPFGIPLTLDSLTYFWYASDTSSLGRLPDGYSFANNGWPIFLAPFFALIKLNSMISYMELQRVISTLVSVLTAIPVYFLCKKFVESRFALFGAAVFAFEPRLIQNSLLGLNDSLYILLGTISLVLFLRNRRISTYVAFAFIGFASVVRSEGLFLFFALSIMYIIRYRKNRNELLRYSMLVAIFAASVLPIAILRIEMTGTDALTGRIANEAIAASSASNVGIIVYVKNTIITFFEFLGRDMIPIFAFFVPVGAFLIFRKRTLEKTTVIITTVIMSIPALYAYSIPALDTKYFYFLYPMFCILTVIAIKKYEEIVSKPIIPIFILIIALSGGIVFLEVKLPDKNVQTEYYEIAKYVTNNALGVNDYYPSSNYLIPAELSKQWPVKNSDFVQHTTIITTKGFDSLESYISSAKNRGLTHVVVDDKTDMPLFLRDVFLHEEKYPYLMKIFDSSEHGYRSHVKIYKIDYTKFISDS